MKWKWKRFLRKHDATLVANQKQATQKIDLDALQKPCNNDLKKVTSKKDLTQYNDAFLLANLNNEELDPTVKNWIVEILNERKNNW